MDSGESAWTEEKRERERATSNRRDEAEEEGEEEEEEEEKRRLIGAWLQQSENKRRRVTSRSRQGCRQESEANRCALVKNEGATDRHDVRNNMKGDAEGGCERVATSE